MNGIDVLVFVSGNDWWVIEVGVYVYVVKDGYYWGLVIW